MPISAANKKRYPPNWWSIRERILERAKHRCELCRAPDRAVIARSRDGTYMIAATGEVFDDVDGTPRGRARGSEYDVDRFTRVVLTIAHLDHVIEHNDDGNLKALCQKCHLAHDQAHHMENARRTRRARKASGDLFE